MSARKLSCILATLAIFLTAEPLLAQGTAFTYQGRLNVGAGAANGNYDLNFTLFNVSSGAGQIGSTLTSTATPVSNGLFTVTLDFGNVFPGADRWLEISVRTNGGGVFSTLSPRQVLTATPYAIRATSVDALGLTGTIPPSSLSGTYTEALNFDNMANSYSGTFYGQFMGLNFIGGSFAGSFIGNGSGLANLNGSQILSGTIPSAVLNNAWRPAGNTGTIPGTHFIGNTDNKPLEFRINNQRVLSIGTNANGSPNFIAGSPANTITGTNTEGSTISGGGLGAYPNRISASYATIGGGTFHNLTGPWSTIAGGRDNTIHGGHATIGGGHANWINTLSAYAAIAGGYQNYIGTNASQSFIGGGAYNSIGNESVSSTIAGGSQNYLLSPYATIGGGVNNFIAEFALGSTIGGGLYNAIQFSGSYDKIGGGFNNIIGSNSFAAVLDGGYYNTMDGDNYYPVLSGGFSNRIGLNTSAAVISGGFNNTVRSNSAYATIPGGVDNFATHYAFAAGNRAKAQHAGAFVWADSQFADFASTANNEVSFRAGGGVRFTTGNGGANQTVSWTPGAASWSFTSDRNTKEKLAPVNANTVLEKIAALPLHEWNYIGYPQRHIGPMAQDFHAQFPLNSDDKALNDADLHGVALAAIQGLNAKVEVRSRKSEDRIHQLETENTDLRQRLEKLESLLQNHR